MYIDACTRLALPYDEARTRMLSVGPAWDRRMMLTLTGLPIGKDVAVNIGRPLEGNGIVAVPVRWKATWPSAAYPSFDGELELTRLSDGSAELWLLGRYEPPFGAVGRMLDQAVLHTVAEDSLRTLVGVMASRLEQPAAVA